MRQLVVTVTLFVYCIWVNLKNACRTTLPIIFGISAAIGAATGIAGLAIQGTQHAYFLEQFAEQKELARLQKLLSEFQIKQFEDAAKEKAIADKANKFNSSIGMRSSFPIPTSTSSMVLRSATNAANFQRNLNVANVINSNNLANIPRGILNPSRNFVTPPRGCKPSVSRPCNAKYTFEKL